jgi:predicted nucleic acid-binding protein
VRYLADTSALVRLLRGQVNPHWDELVERGLVALCEPVLIESLTIADAKSFRAVEEELRATYPWVPVPDDVWAIVGAVQRDLAEQSQHHGVSIADHLVVATAIRLKLVVLHDDADFETVARLVPQLQQQRISAPM